MNTQREWCCKAIEDGYTLGDIFLLGGLILACFGILALMVFKND